MGGKKKAKKKDDGDGNSPEEEEKILKAKVEGLQMQLVLCTEQKDKSLTVEKCI